MRMVRRALGIAAVSLLSVAFLGSPASAVDHKLLDDIRAQAQQAEKDGKWSEACSCYAFLLTHKAHTRADDREHFQTCLRHLHRTRRHMDSSYRQQVLEQDSPVALKVYGEVLGQLRTEYAEEDRADLGRLFHQGIHEFRLALLDPAFQKLYLPAASKNSIDHFLANVAKKWTGKAVKNIDEAKTFAFRVALQARADLGIKPTVTVLEFACGACNALDEHTYYMTPRQFGEDLSSLRGETVGVGIEVELADRKLVVGQVVINSPAARAGLRGREEIVGIDRIPADKLTVDGANDKLKGKLGTVVEIEIATPGESKPRVVSLVRQAVNASVTFYRMLDPTQGIAYISLVAFHENTLQELDEAIRNLEMQGMKVLILDLRGNAGGLFDAAVQVAERFLWEGAYIVSTKGKVREVKRVSRNANPSTVPLVVLVDGGTASAAEILAGALKENVTDDMQPRAKVIGMPTFGKGTVQHMVELKSVQAGGIRITWAKFYSPRNNPYNGTGVEPHFKIENPDQQIAEGVAQAREIIGRMITMMR
jgi:carboxyl-terminal processing protease